MRLGRKTFKVEEIRNTVNFMLQHGKHSADFRFGAATMLEEILHSSGNYNGFGYHTEKDVPVGELPGVRTGPNGESLNYDERFKNTDDSRRYYY